MKVLLISIDLILGTRILLSLLKSRDFDAHNLQIAGIKYSDTFSQSALREIYEFTKGYQVIGLSFNSFYSPLAAQLGRYLKSKNVKWIIAGGPHATALPEETLEYSDMAVIYEAERTLPELLKKLGANESFRNVPGIAFKDRLGRMVRTLCPEIENNLDNVPFQNISPEDISYYDFGKKSFEKPTRDTLFPHGGQNHFILTSRGCPFNCAYCCNNLFAKLNKAFMKVRKRSIVNIISEMKEARQAGFKGFYIADDNFFAFTLKEMEDFSKLYRTGINLPFGIGGLNPNNMRSKDSAKKLDLLLKAGLSDVRIGVQSGSDKTLKRFGRKYKAGELPGLLKVFENRKTIWKGPDDKLRIAVDFICDAPWENAKDREKTLMLANNLLSTYGIFFYTLIYLPGTDIYELALREGWVKDKKKDIYLRGIAGVDDNIHNRLLFLIAVLKERGGKIPDSVLRHILRMNEKNPVMAKKFIDFTINAVNDVEKHHAFRADHLTLHPYLRGFNEWTKTTGRKNKKVLFRSYHEPYG